MKFDIPAELFGLGLYKSLTFIGIGIGIWLLLLGIKGVILPPLPLLFLGAFTASKEVMDLMHSG